MMMPMKRPMNDYMNMISPMDSVGMDMSAGTALPSAGLMPRMPLEGPKMPASGPVMPQITLPTRVPIQRPGSPNKAISQKPKQNNNPMSNREKKARGNKLMLA